MLTATEFYFLRHGETDWNLQGRAQGQTDVPLNDRGRAQAHAAQSLTKHLPITRICSSPLSRALETAEILQEALGCSLEVIEELRECSWGVCEGGSKGDWFQDWKSSLSNPVGAEPYEALLKRALRGLNKALAYPGPVLIVAHGGVYWSVQKHAALGAEFDLPNAVPVRHEPPREGFPWWQASELDEHPRECNGIEQ